MCVLPTHIVKGHYRAPPRPQWVAAFMSAHSKTPYIPPSMAFSLWEWGSMGAQGAAAGNYLLISYQLCEMLSKLMKLSPITASCKVSSALTLTLALTASQVSATDDLECDYWVFSIRKTLVQECVCTSTCYPRRCTSTCYPRRMHQHLLPTPVYRRDVNSASVVLAFTSFPSGSFGHLTKRFPRTHAQHAYTLS